MRLSVRRFLVGVLISLAALSFYGAVKASSPDMAAKQDASVQTETPMQAPEDQGQALRVRQSQEDVDAKSTGCQSCHTATDSVSMHKSPAVDLVADMIGSARRRQFVLGFRFEVAGIVSLVQLA